MCDIYGDTCDVWVETPRRARKLHYCCECQAPIPPGHAYIQINTVHDGSAGTSRRHTACVVIWQVIARGARPSPRLLRRRGGVAMKRPYLARFVASDDKVGEPVFVESRSPKTAASAVATSLTPMDRLSSRIEVVTLESGDCLDRWWRARTYRICMKRVVVEVSR